MLLLLCLPPLPVHTVCRPGRGPATGSTATCNVDGTWTVSNECYKGEADCKARKNGVIQMYSRYVHVLVLV